MISAMGLFLGPIPIVVFSFGVFVKPLIHEFHAARATISLAFTLHSVAVALLVPVAGRLLDRVGTRKLLLFSTTLTGLVLLTSCFCSDHLGQVYALYVTLGVCTCGATPVSYSDLISHWFDKRRGLALGCMMFGLGAGALIMPSVAQFLIAHFGWRLAFAASGAANLAVTLPLLAIFMKERPASMGLLPDGAVYQAGDCRELADEAGMSWMEASRTQLSGSCSSVSC